jgi:hypothetical protein
MALVGETQLGYNLVYSHATILQTRFHQFQLIAGDILLQAFSGLLLEIFADIVRRKIEVDGNMLASVRTTLLGASKTDDLFPRSSG